MEAFSLGVRERRGGVHKTGVGGCIHRMIHANRLKVARVSNDLRDFRQFFQLVGHETVGESDSPGCRSFDRERLQKKTRNTLKPIEINNSLNSLF